MGNYFDIANKMFGVFDLEREMSVGVTLFYKVNLEVIVPYSYRGIPLYFNQTAYWLMP